MSEHTSQGYLVESCRENQACLAVGPVSFGYPRPTHVVPIEGFSELQKHGSPSYAVPGIINTVHGRKTG